MNPTFVITADLTGNGKLDLVTVNTNGNSVSVFLGNGDGTFQQAITYPVGMQPLAAAVGDLNNDGVPDLVCVNNGSSNFSLLLGNGDGTFRAAGTVATDRLPRAVAVSDFNHDGKLDLVVTGGDGYSTNNVDVFLGNGNGTFQARVNYPAKGWPADVAVGDLAHNGVLDIVTDDPAGLTSQLHEYVGNGNGTFQNPVDIGPGITPSAVTIADINGDGYPDLLSVGNYVNGYVSALLNNGNGTFQTPKISGVGGPPPAMAVGDFDRDGRLDVVVPHWQSNTVGVVRGNGDGTFQAPILYPVGNAGSSPTSVAVGDFNGDGFPDLAVTNSASNQVTILLDQPNATHFGVSVTGNPVAGTAFTMTVTALDGGNTTATNFQGAVHFTSTDGSATLPPDYTFTANDRGVKSFTVTLRTAGNQTITATSGTTITGSAPVTVSPAAAASLVIAGFPSPVTAGLAGNVTVTARDLYGNTAAGYRGSVHLSSSDAQASLPATYAFTSTDNGVHTFSATLKTAGSQSVTATDVSTTSLTGTQTGILVNPAAASQLQLMAPATVAPHATFPLTVRALDPYTNVATGYRGALHFSVTDPRATPLPDYTFTAADAGTHQFLTSLVTVGSQTVTAQDQANRIMGSVNVAVVLAPLFDAAISLNAGAQPRAVATGDFNGDGTEDLVVANESGNNITVILGLGDGSFLNGVNYPAGPAPTSVVAADFNGDGILDLAVADNGGHTVSLLLGNGDGSFQPARNLTVGSGPISVAAADLNGDGIIDLAVANKNSSTVSLLLGNGDGSFQPAQNFPVDSNPWSVAVGDINGDGIPDLVTANDVLSVSLLLGRGDGTYRPAINLVAGGASPRAVAVADINGDGIPDLVTANYNSNTVSVYPGRGDGTFRTAVNYDVQAGPQSMLVADVNGDGFPDIVTADQGGAGVGVLVNRGDGTFQPAQYYRAGLIPLDVALGDFNGDGAPDLAVANSDSINVSVLLNLAPPTSLTVTAPASRVADTPFSVTVTAQNAFDGQATGYRGMIHFTSTDPAATLAADYTFTAADAGVHTFLVRLHTLGRQTITVQDTATDGLVGSATVAVISPTLFYPAVNYPVGRQPNYAAVGDFNGDGIPDLVTANGADGTISVLLGRGDGTFQAARNFAAGPEPTNLAVGDFNGDGLLDVVVTNGRSSPTVSVLLGNGDGTFQAPRTFAAGSFPGGIAVGDFNGDGILDLATANSFSYDLTVLLGNGDGTFQRPVSYHTGVFSRDVVAGDFNGDGILDLAVANQGEDTVSVLRGNGDGTFGPAINYAVGAAPTGMTLGDFNGDGVLDLVTANYTFGGLTSTVSVLLGNGDGTFRPAVSYAVGRNAGSVAVGDFNGDGAPDLAVTNAGESTVSLLLGNGDGTFQNPLSVAVGSSPSSAVVSDFNSDGYLDLAVSDAGANTISVLLNTGDQSGRRGGVGRRMSYRVTTDLNRASWLGIADALPIAPKPAPVVPANSAVATRISRDKEQLDWAFATLGSSPERMESHPYSSRLMVREPATSGEQQGFFLDLDDPVGAMGAGRLGG